jgi:hypothetical protein
MTFSPFIRYWRNTWDYNETVYQLLMDFGKAYGSAKREVLCNILIHFGILMKLVRLTKMCLNEMYVTVHLCKYLSRMTASVVQWSEFLATDLEAWVRFPTLPE